MIAPIQRTKDPPGSPEMRRAHRLVASTLLKKQRYPADDAPPVPAWRAWLFTAWVVTATAAYLAYMVGLLY